MKKTKIAFFGLMPMALTAWAQGTAGSERPNIVWFLTEDVSAQYLAHFNEGQGAETPYVEQLAQHGITFMNAYSCAPVSSAARTTLITGCYAPSFEGAFHRTLGASDMPHSLRMFPSYLREAGYYTCNAHKTDYNVKLDKTAWDDIKGSLESFQNRPDKNKPFFLMRTTMTTHEGKVQFNAGAYQQEPTVFNPDSVHLHPYLPDTRLMRYTYARFYDRIKDSDAELGEVIQMLEKEGKLDNTFIFYFGDNGGSLPGTKGYTNDIGLHVPLVVYVPEKWKDKVSQPYGSRENGLVSFMDFAPTVLKLAGVDLPERMDGRPFLGKEESLDNRAVFGYGDRYDECYAFNRCIRVGKYRYARNYQPYHSRAHFAFFRYKQLAFREWMDLYHQGKLTLEQQRFFGPMGAEELYDLENDPNELHNLAADPAYREVVEDLRGQLNQNLKDKADLGFYPETLIQENAMPDADAFGKRHAEDIALAIDLADMQLQPYSPEMEGTLRQNFRNPLPIARWWAITACTSFGKEAVGLQPDLERLVNDGRAYIGSRAFVAMARLGKQWTKNDFMKIMQRARTEAEAMLVLDDLTYLVEEGYIEPFPIALNELRFKKTREEWRVRFLDSFTKSEEGQNRWNTIYKLTPFAPLFPERPAEGVVLFETFGSGMGEFTLENPAGSLAEPVWQAVSANGDYGMKAYGLVQGKKQATESWLVSPVVDLTQATDCRLQFDNAAQFFDAGTGYSVQVRVEGGDWETVPMLQAHSGHSWKFVKSTVDLKSYEGKKIQFAFVYKSSAADCGCWEIKNVSVLSGQPTGIRHQEMAPRSHRIFDFNGRPWSKMRKGLMIIDGEKVWNE